MTAWHTAGDKPLPEAMIAWFTDSCMSRQSQMSWNEYALQWRHNERDSASNHQPHHCLLNRIFRRRSKKTSKVRVTGPCVGNSPVTGEFPAQIASNAENVSIWWRHHGNIDYMITSRGCLYMFIAMMIYMTYGCWWPSTRPWLAICRLWRISSVELD